MQRNLSVILASLAGASHAQWTVTVLHPEGAIESVAHSIDGAQQAGYARFLPDLMPAFTHAAVWSGTAESWRDFNPENAWYSEIRCVRDSVQAGIAAFNGVGGTRATLWYDDAESWVNLHNNSFGGGSSLEAVHDGVQVGYTDVTACSWNGSAASILDIGLGSMSSQARDVHDGTIAGWRWIDGEGPHAGVWVGLTSWVDLHPTGSGGSHANAIHNGYQVGGATIDGFLHAALWSGTPESFVDLNPMGASQSEALGVHEGYQVGYAIFAGGARIAAVLWSGTAESYEDLTGPLGPEWSNVYARDVWTDGQTIYVVGSGLRSGQGIQALMWTRPTDDCLPDTNHDGSLTPADFSAWIAAFNANAPACDQNTDGLCTPADFTAWLANYNAGCP